MDPKREELRQTEAEIKALLSIARDPNMSWWKRRRVLKVLHTVRAQHKAQAIALLDTLGEEA